MSELLELWTVQLVLRPPREDQAADALVMLTDPEVRQWHPCPSVVDLESARAWCRRGAAWDETHATWHAVDRHSGRLVANASLYDVDEDHRTAEISYRVAPWARGRGVATEVVRVLCDWAFAERSLVRVQLEHSVGNPASCSVATKAGFAFEGILRSSYLAGDGLRHDSHVHGRVLGDP